MLVDGITIISTFIGFEGNFGTLRASEDIKSLDQMGTDLDKAIAAYDKLHANDEPTPSYFETIDLDDYSPNMNLW